MIRTIATAAVGAAIAFGLAGCGERPQVIEYKQGKYQGKADTQPYDSATVQGRQGRMGARHQEPQPEPERVQAHQLISRGATMASNTLKRAAGVLLAALVLGAAAVGQAQQSPSAIAQSQSPAVNPQEADLAKRAGGAAAEAAAQQPAGVEGGALGAAADDEPARTRDQRADPVAGTDLARGAGHRLDRAGLGHRRARRGAVRVLLLARDDRAPRSADRSGDRTVLAGEALRPLGDGAHLRRAGDHRAHHHLRQVAAAAADRRDAVFLACGAGQERPQLHRAGVLGRAA